VKLPESPHYDAVIFDFDGVLIESMPQHVRSWQAIFRPFGVELEPLEIYEREGEKASLTTRLLVERHGLRLSEAEMDELVVQKRLHYRRQAPRGLRPLARRTVEEVRASGYRTAIVTGSVLPNLEWTLTPEELRLFDVIVTSEMVAMGKPHPEPYLLAAKRLELDPTHCLVVENAPLGIHSAKAAGMRVVAVTTTLPKESLAEADHIVSDLDQLLPLPDVIEKS